MSQPILIFISSTQYPSLGVSEVDEHEDDEDIRKYLSKQFNTDGEEFKDFLLKEFKTQKVRVVADYTGPGMTNCPNCGGKINELVHDSGADYPFPHIDLTYSCKCGFYEHFTLVREKDSEWLKKAYRPPLDLSKYL